VVNTNGARLFARSRIVLDRIYGGIAWLLQSPPFFVVVIAFALLAGALSSALRRRPRLSDSPAAPPSGYGPETMVTLALIATAIGAGHWPSPFRSHPRGISMARFNACFACGSIYYQTLPPYIYLRPAIR